jgi:hypothetical protein
MKNFGRFVSRDTAPGKHDDILACVIRHFPLDQCPNYEALSYVWGDSGQTRPLYIIREDDIGNRKLQILNITPNLDDALRAKS